jgi:hypothetical protein
MQQGQAGGEGYRAASSKVEQERERKVRQGGFENTKLDDISLSAHRTIYLLTSYYY